MMLIVTWLLGENSGRGLDQQELIHEMKLLLYMGR